MTPSEKHMETAKQIVDGVLMNDLDVIAVAAVVASIERDGMKRAAEIAQRQARFHLEASAMALPVEPSPIIAKDRAGIANRIASAILSEAGDD